jgi:fibronectin type 3 domain-containing protein
MRSDRKSVKRVIPRRHWSDRERHGRVVRQAAHWDIQVLESRVLLSNPSDIPQIVGETSAQPELSAAAAVGSAGPIGVTATPNNNGTTTISWKAVAGATSYNIYRGVVQGQEASTPYSTGVKSTSFIDLGTTNLSTRYYYTVTAVTSGESLPSAEVSAVPQFFAHINFSSPTGNAVPGYLKDSGEKYPFSLGTFTEGWSINNTANSRDRDSSKSPDELHDSFIHLDKQTPSASWSINVPVGTYSVHLLSGDPLNFNSVYKLNVNGNLIVSGTPTASHLWFAGTINVSVTNGKITVADASGGSNGKIDEIDITSALAPLTVTPKASSDGTISLTWPAIPGALGYKVYRGNASTAESLAPLGPIVTTPTYTDSTVSNGKTYFYEVTTVNQTGESVVGNEASITSSVTPSAGWYNSAWEFRNPLTITNTTAGILNNYQAEITVPYDSRMQANFNDVLFTSTDGVTPISYWLEPDTETNSVTATFWVNVPTLPASGATTIYMYFGNPTAKSLSNGNTTFSLFDDFSTPAPAGAWVPSAANPVVSPTLSWEGTFTRDADVLYENGQYEMWYWGSGQHLGYATSTDGISWHKVTELNISGARPSVVHQGSTYYLYTNDETNILVSTSSSPQGPFSTPVKVLTPSLAWEGGVLKVPSVIYDPDDGLWKMWYSAGEYTPAGVGYTEPLEIGYATSSNPLKGWTKHGNPIITPTAGNSWSSRAIQAFEVTKVNGVYYAAFTGADYWGTARIGFVSSTSPTNWTLSANDLILNTGQTPAAGSWNQDFLYNSRPVFANGQWSDYFNARNNSTGVEQLGLVTMSTTTATNSNLLDTTKWTLTRQNNVTVNTASSTLSFAGTSPDNNDESLISNQSFTNGIVEARMKIDTGYTGPSTEAGLGARFNGIYYDMMSKSQGPTDAYETLMTSGSSSGSSFRTGKFVNGKETILNTSTATAITKGTWYIQSLAFSGSTIKSYLNGAQIYSTTDSSVPASGSIYVRSFQALTDVDWIFVRTYASSPPSIAFGKVQTVSASPSSTAQKSTAKSLDIIRTASLGTVGGNYRMDAVDDSSILAPATDKVTIGKNVTIATPAAAALSNPASALSTAFSDSQIGADKTSRVDDVLAMLA